MEFLRNAAAGAWDYINTNFLIHATNIGVLYGSLPYLCEQGLGGKIAGVSIIGVNLGAGVIRYREYRKIKETLEESGWDAEMISSICDLPGFTRSASLAARATGYEAEFENLCKMEGHRWYHILLPKRPKKKVLDMIDVENVF